MAKTQAQRKALWIEVMQEIADALKAKAEGMKPRGVSDMSGFDVRAWGETQRAASEAEGILRMITDGRIEPSQKEQ